MTGNQNTEATEAPKTADEKADTTPTEATQTEATEAPKTADEKADTTPTEATQTEAPEAPEAPETDAETFPREYVQKLRQEAADARVKAKRADELARELFTAKVIATGRLADPTDLPFSEELLADSNALDEAITTLLEKKPHLASRTPQGDIGQGPAGGDSGTVDLAALLRAGA